MALCAILWSSALYAQPQQSASFRITHSVLDGSGGSSASASFRLSGALGQPTPIGAQSSANFALSAGFLSPVFAISPLSPIQHLVILFDNPDVHLNWERIATAQSYSVYRDTTALFTPGAANQIGTATDTFYVDVNALNLPLGKYFYSVQSSHTSLLNASASPPALTKSESNLHPSVDQGAEKARQVIAPKAAHRK
jgi:hypothetical protein